MGNRCVQEVAVLLKQNKIKRIKGSGVIVALVLAGEGVCFLVEEGMGQRELGAGSGSSVYKAKNRKETPEARKRSNTISTSLLGV